jgi:Uma2 family endonuclease
MVLGYKPMTLADYLAYDDGTDRRYELENGAILPMPPESFRNQRIGILLLLFFADFGIDRKLLVNQLALAVTGGRSTARIPDLMILSEELAQELQETNQGTILLDMPPPRLVVEIVSPGQDKRDYRYKRSEYGARQIPEYWIVDPILEQVMVLELVDGFYEDRVYKGEEPIVSPELGRLQLRVQDILEG